LTPESKDLTGFGTEGFGCAMAVCGTNVTPITHGEKTCQVSVINSAAA
jgi:hypothetical protein